MSPTTSPELLMPLAMLESPSIVPRSRSAYFGSGGAAAPVSVRACGLPGALLLIVSVAVRLPAAAGVKMRVTVRLSPGPSVTPVRSALRAKSAALVPAMAALTIVRGAVPGLLRVSDCAARAPTAGLPKLMAGAAGLSLIGGGGRGVRRET